MRSLNDRVLIKPDEQPQRSAGGIIIPDSAKDSILTCRGTVVAAGPGSLTVTGERMPLQTQPGDRVIWNKYHGLLIEDGDQFVLSIREDELLAAEDPELEGPAHVQ